jgi:hypothetical protein
MYEVKKGNTVGLQGISSFWERDLMVCNPLYPIATVLNTPGLFASTALEDYNWEEHYTRLLSAGQDIPILDLAKSDLLGTRYEPDLYRSSDVDSF